MKILDNAGAIVFVCLLVVIFVYAGTKPRPDRDGNYLGPLFNN